MSVVRSLRERIQESARGASGLHNWNQPSMAQPSAPTEHDRQRAARERMAIDASCRVPVLYFAASAVMWLLVGSLLALLASIKLNSPYFLTGTGPLGFGRVRMAHLQAVGIGWAALAGMAAAVWLMCRLC